MVVQVKSRIRHSSKTMEGNQQKVEANILLLGAENVGKSGKFCTDIASTSIYSLNYGSNNLCVLFTALTVRFLTRRFIGEYGDIGKHKGYTHHHSLVLIPIVMCSKISFVWPNFFFSFSFTESIYSHTDKIDGRDICFNIWDSLCHQVSIVLPITKND